MISFLDTSFLLKLYIEEADSVEASALIGESGNIGVVSSFADVEVASALFRKLPQAQARDIHKQYRRNRLDGVFAEARVDNAVFSLATSLAEQYAEQLFLRSLDIMHLATALNYGATGFATYDRRLATAAGRVGFSVIGARQ